MPPLMIFLAVILTLFLVNSVWLAVYCRLEAKIDRMQEPAASGGGTAAAALENKGRFFHLLKELYKYLDHYFYGWMRYCILQVGHIPSNRIRNFLYRTVFFMKLSKGTVISAGCEIRSPWNIKLGRCTVMGNCILDGRSGLVMEDNVVLGMCVHIWTQEHDVNSPSFAVPPEHRGKVVIHERAWVCSDSTILPGLDIGEGAVVASRACVTKDCAPFTIYGGVPAKKIGERSHDLTYQLSGKPHWHFY